MSYTNSHLLILQKELQTPGYLQYTKWDQQPGNGQLSWPRHDQPNHDHVAKIFTAK